MPSNHKPPKYLSAEAKSVFKESLPLLDGVSPTAIHLHQLEMYSQSVAEYREYTAIIAKDGPIQEDPNGMERKHPLLISQAKALDMATKMANELGLTRKKVAVNAKPQAKKRSLRKETRSKAI